MKFKTIREGTSVVVYNYNGEGSIVEGPQRLFLFRQRIVQMRFFSASETEYLVITDIDGRTMHKRGPCSMYLNPLKHENIYLKPAIILDANHMIVVYRQVKTDVERRTIQGPAVFVPTADEWLHEFVFHGPDPNDNARMIPKGRITKQLPVIPEHFYYNIHEVRTCDDTMITVKLMIFYQLTEILNMLDLTHDPIADMINAVCSDIISYAGALTYEQFVKQTDRLSNLESYPQLVQRGKRIGFNIQKVVYRGYRASDRLQAMQNSAIESRTKLRLTTEIEDVQQRIADFKLTKEQARTQLKQALDNSKQDHTQKIARMSQQHNSEMKNLEHKQLLDLVEKERDIHIQHYDDVNTQNEKYLEELKNLGVDLTKYLTLKNKSEIIEQIEIVKNKGLILSSAF